MATGAENQTAKPTTRGPIHPGMTVRLVASDYPGALEVFQRHGETERPAIKFGHLEPIGHFAKRSGISLKTLMDELSQATGAKIVGSDPDAWQPHRPFIATALVVTLTLGAGWGAWLLTEIGLKGSLTAISANSVVAHGEAQFWGFIAPFIIGIASGFLPKTTASPRPSRLLLATLLATLLLTVLGGFAWSMAPARLNRLGYLSGIAALLTAMGYALMVSGQVGGKWRTPWARFVIASVFWMAYWASATFSFRGQALAAGPGAYSESARNLLLEMALFGFALNAVYGFGLRLLPGMLGKGAPKQPAVEKTFALHNMGVLALALSHFWGLRVLEALGAVLIASGALPWVLGLHGTRTKAKSAPRPEAGSPLLPRYIQLALFWFVIGLAMLAIGGVFAAVRGEPLHKAYTGATRHALTVGFLTTLILGVAQRLLPILSHDLLAWPGLVGPILILIGVGNALRVTMELATMVWPVAFWIMPFSALLELSALSLFAANAFRTLWPARDPLLRTGRATALTRASILVAEHPWIEDHLIASGVGYFARVRSVPAELTLGSLATSKKLDSDAMVAEINALLEAKEAKRAAD